MKKFTKKYWVIISSFLVLLGCSNQVPKKDLKQLQQQNNQIVVTDNWQYTFCIDDNDDKHCGAELKKEDTTYYIEYSFIKKTKKYYPSGVYKSYTTPKRICHRMELLNNDTLYAFHCNKEDSLFFPNYIFSTGKYYYMAKRRLNMNEKQYRFYQQHKDSLIHVKGNDLPPLPESE